MKRLAFLLLIFCMVATCVAQEKRAQTHPDLPDIKPTIRDVQADAALYVKNYSNHSEEHDVNSIILDIERYIDSMPKKNTYADRLLMKSFDPLRHFFLTTTNKTTVATMFLYRGTPYNFCLYNDSAVVLFIHAVKDGNTYNLGKMTEKKVVRSVFDNCLLPSLKALDEFKEGEIKYIALSVYYGCKDTRDGASTGITPYSLTLLARTADLQQYASGILTTKGLLANAELYAGDGSSVHELVRVQIDME